jgi:hypothetical protein
LFGIEANEIGGDPPAANRGFPHVSGILLQFRNNQVSE